MDLRKIQQAELEKSKTKSKVKTWKISLGALLLTTIITTIAVNATDNIGNFSNSILGSVVSSGENQQICPPEMSHISSPSGGFCIDKFEASAGGGCPIKNPQNSNDTTTNLSSSNCKAESVKGAVPWTNIARHQAELACAQAGKYLPSNQEWYRASLGTPDSEGNVNRGDCNLNGSAPPKKTGELTKCISSNGAYDMIGNVWEWVGEVVSNGELRGKTLPQEGFVASIDIDGVPIDTATTSDKSFNDDYFFINQEGSRGMFRGGYWGSGTDGGQYAVNIITPPSFTGAAVGFRCAK